MARMDVRATVALLLWQAERKVYFFFFFLFFVFYVSCKNVQMCVDHICSCMVSWYLGGVEDR